MLLEKRREHGGALHEPSAVGRRRCGATPRPFRDPSEASPSCGCESNFLYSSLTVTVLCLPARGEADEIVALMLAQLLDLEGLRTVAASEVSLASEAVELVAQYEAAAVCISALLPAALAHSRYLCKRLYGRFPQLPTVIGLWTSKADPKTSLTRLSCAGSSRLVTSLGAAIVEIQQMVRPLLFQRGIATADERRGEPEPVGP